MSTRRTTTISTNALYLIAGVIIILAFLLLGGGHWVRGMMHENRYIGVDYWNWTQILISLAIGFILGLLVARRKR
jgi:hypothetical protein